MAGRLDRQVDGLMALQMFGGLFTGLDGWLDG